MKKRRIKKVLDFSEKICYNILMNNYRCGDKVRICKGARWRPSNVRRNVDVNIPLKISAIVSHGEVFLFRIDGNPHLYEDETFKLYEVMPVGDETIILDDEAGLDEDFIDALLED